MATVQLLKIQRSSSYDIPKQSLKINLYQRANKITKLPHKGQRGKTRVL